MHDRALATSLCDLSISSLKSRILLYITPPFLLYPQQFVVLTFTTNCCRITNVIICFYKKERFNMKKLIIFALAGIFVIASAGCFPMKTSDSQAQISTVAAETTNKAEIATSKAESKTETETQPETQKEANQLLYDDNGIVITYMGMGSGWMGKQLKLKVENKTNKNYTIQARNASINGCMVNPVFSCNVNAGKTANDDIDFMSSDLEKNSITTIEEIEFSFHIFNSDTWSESFDSNAITIKP